MTDEEELLDISIPLIQFRADLLEMLRQPYGRRVLWWVLSQSGLHDSPQHSNPFWQYFADGQRSVGVMLLDEIVQAAPEMYQQMLKENQDNG